MEFKFKQFTIKQERSAMKVNTDGVLLGAWMSLLWGPEELQFPQPDLQPSQPNSQPSHSFAEEFILHLLDIGTGTGVISLMAAQRFAQMQNSNIIAVIDAVEIDMESYKDAVENFANSPWGAEPQNIFLRAEYSSLQQHAQQPSALCLKYDLIFSNPPYFIDSLKTSEQARSNARHTDTLSQSEIIRYSRMLLKKGGRLALILPAAEGDQFLQKINFLLQAALKKAEQQQNLQEGVLVPVRLCKVCTTARKAPKRYLMEFEFTTLDLPLPVCTYEQLIMMENNHYTTSYRNLTAPFYLDF